MAPSGGRRVGISGSDGMLSLELNTDEFSAEELEACVEQCCGMAENGHQILLVFQLTTMLERIRRRPEQAKVSCFTLEGSTPKEQCARLVRDFNAGKAQVLLISLKAGGTSLNLTAADVVIHYDPCGIWRPGIRPRTGSPHRAARQCAGVQAHCQGLH